VRGCLTRRCCRWVDEWTSGRVDKWTNEREGYTSGQLRHGWPTGRGTKAVAAVAAVAPLSAQQAPRAA
jgi:hypothetical protein